MRQQEIFKKIGGILKELNEQYEYLQAADDNLNDLELELFVANANFLTDHVEILYKLNLQGPQRLLESKTAKTGEKFFEPVVQQVTYDITAEEPVAEAGGQHEPEEPEHHEEPVAEAEVQHEAEAQQPVEPIEEPLPLEHEPAKEEHTFDWRNGNHTEVVAEEKEPEHHYTPAAITETIREPENEVVTINDRIAEKIEPVSEPRLSDLKQGITLNDKLLFVKDLFNGYNLAYSEAVEILNRYSNFDEAAKFLKTNYVTKNNWDSKPATTEKFYALLKRRYS